MSRLIQSDQYTQLMHLRQHCIAALATGNSLEMQRCTGMVQGFLLGLHVAGEIDAGDMEALELDAFEHFNFMRNARKASQVKAQHPGVAS